MNMKSKDDLLLRQNIKLIENDRREIAYELHNEIGQHLTAIRTAAHLMHRQSEGRQTIPVAESIITLTDQLHEMIAQLLRRLHPSVLEKFGLRDSLHELMDFMKENMHLECHLEVEGDMSTLEKDLELAVYRIVQESLTNAVRHGQATEASIHFICNSDAVQIAVVNNGLPLTGNIDALIQDQKSGIGLLGIKHRAEAWHGNVQLENLAEGVTLSCSIPLAK